MLVIAERINATRKRIRRAILDRAADLIRLEARTQVDAGADYIDGLPGVAGQHERRGAQSSPPGAPGHADDQLDHR